MSRKLKDALASFTFGERLKSLVLMGQAMVDGLARTRPEDRKGALEAVSLYLKAAANEARLAATVTREESFHQLAEELMYARGKLALKEEESATQALGRALVRATTVSQRASEPLAGEGLL